jgi:hypothetical protein
MFNLKQRNMVTMVEAHIKELFHTYRSTPDLEYKGLYFSSTCMQVCRQIPSFAATTREQIVQHQRDADAGKFSTDNAHATNAKKTESTTMDPDPKPRLLYSIKPISISESSFGTRESCEAIDLIPSRIQRQAEDERWIGMRVFLWDESKGGLLVKVQYWWREEESGQGKVWRQCLHDIMYLGPKDGTEGGEEQVLVRGW